MTRHYDNDYSKILFGTLKYNKTLSLGSTITTQNKYLLNSTLVAIFLCKRFYLLT